MSNIEDNHIINEYIRSVVTSRNTVNNILNVISNQDRTLRTIVNHTLNNNERNEQRDNITQRDARHRRYNPNRHNVGYRINNPNYSRPHARDHQIGRSNLGEAWANSLFTSLANTNIASPNVETSNSSPTTQQIENATEEVLFSSITTPLNNTCPITTDIFNPNDTVMQIIPCGHIFSPDNLRQWFQTNQRCPLCRIDITRYDPRQSIRNPYSSSERGSQPIAANRSVPDIATFITTDLLRQMQDISGNITVEYAVINNNIRDISNSGILYDASLSGVIRDGSVNDITYYPPYTYTT